MDNNLYKKAYAFAVRVTNAYQFLSEEKQEFVPSKQLLKSGTSIGANTAEANGAISKAELSAKLSISYKECLETNYWLSLLMDTEFIDEKHLIVFLKMPMNLQEFYLLSSKRHA